jgi:hypothetical protein
MFDVIACGELLIDFVSTQSGVARPGADSRKPRRRFRRCSGCSSVGYRAGFSGRWATTTSGNSGRQSR